MILSPYILVTKDHQALIFWEFQFGTSVYYCDKNEWC